MEGMVRGHRSLTHETLRTSRVRAHPAGETKMAQVCAIHELDTWITPVPSRLRASTKVKVKVNVRAKVNTWWDHTKGPKKEVNRATT